MNGNPGLVLGNGPDGWWDSLSCSSPQVLREADGSWRMWYYGRDRGFDRSIAGSDGRTGLATSTDGIVWERVAGPLTMGAVLEPTLLILDEPTEGIQPNIVHEIGDIILKLNAETGLTILLVEQKLPFARRVASDFHVLEKGRRVAGGTIAELSDDVVHRHLSV